tara:strand:+ start:157 stop:648 length:492 start_codon:yes stop_codon:yes gene_type:complete
MLVGVVSDTHNLVANVEKIIDIFNMQEVDLTIHTGDITKASTLKRFSRLDSKLIGVYGNNDLEEKGLKETSFNNKFEFQEPPLIRDIGGKKILILHEPDEIKEFIESDPSIDVVLHGHTHRYVNKKIKGVKIINPGECAGMLKGKNAIGILNLNDLSFKRIFF